MNRRSMGTNSQSQQDQRPRAKQIDYLAEFRLKKDGNENYENSNNNEKVINQLLNDKTMNEFEKMEAVKRKAVQME